MRQNTIAALLLAAGLSAHAGPATPPSTTYNLALDGFCDGVELTVERTTGLVSGTRTGCAEGQVLHGNAGGIAGRGLSLTIRGANGTGFDGVDIIATFSLSQGTWDYRRPDGSIFNSGTFSVNSRENNQAMMQKAGTSSTGN